MYLVDDGVSLKRAKEALAKFTRVLCSPVSEVDEGAAKHEVSDAIHLAELSFHEHIEVVEGVLNDRAEKEEGHAGVDEEEEVVLNADADEKLLLECLFDDMETIEFNACDWGDVLA